MCKKEIIYIKHPRSCSVFCYKKRKLLISGDSFETMLLGKIVLDKFKSWKINN